MPRNSATCWGILFGRPSITSASPPSATRILSLEPANWRQKYPWFISYCGDIDAVGHKKPQSYYRDVLWGRSQLEVAVAAAAAHGQNGDAGVLGLGG